MMMMMMMTMAMTVTVTVTIRVQLMAFSMRFHRRPYRKWRWSQEDGPRNGKDMHHCRMQIGPMIDVFQNLGTSLDLP